MSTVHSSAALPQLIHAIWAPMHAAVTMWAVCKGATTMLHACAGQQ